VDDGEKLEKGLELIREGRRAEFNGYLAKLRDDEPLLSSLLEVGAQAYTHTPLETIRKGNRLLARVSDKPRLAVYLFAWLGTAYRLIGEMGTSDNYFLREIETAERMGDRDRALAGRMDLLYNRFIRAEYESLYREIRERARDASFSGDYDTRYILASLEIVRGRPEKAVEALTSFLGAGDRHRRQQVHMKEVLGFATRMTGDPEGAFRLYMESVEGLLEFDSVYAAFPLAKAMELVRLSGIEPPPGRIIRRCLALARKGSWGEIAAAQEIEALLIRDDAGAAEKLLEAAKNYARVHQNIEATAAGLTAAWLAWRAESHVFPKALRFLAPLVALHPGFRRDPVLGGFLARIEPLLGGKDEGESGRGIKAHLIDGLRVSVGGRETRLARCGNRKAVQAFVYLLLTPKHRMSRDHLFYLIWPRRRYAGRTRQGLYNVMAMIRKDFGVADLLTRRYDYYQLEEVWTDLGELEDLVRRADGTGDPTEREEHMRRARELAKGELLPEFPYDSYIDEYRQYYDRLRKRVFGE
jgi:hypothetical protein